MTGFALDANGALVITSDPTGAKWTQGFLRSPLGAVVATGGGGGIADWAPLTNYVVGQLVKYQSEIYEAVNAHTSPAAWYPARFRRVGTLPKGWLGRGLVPLSNRHGRWDTNSSSGATLSNGTDTDHNSKITHTAVADSDHVYLLFHAPSPMVAADVITINAKIEYASGTFHEVTFNGQPTAQLKLEGVVLSDPVPIAVRATEQFWVKTHVVAAAGQKWPLTHFSAEAGELAANAAAPTDLTAGVIVGNATAFSAFAVLYRPTGRVPHISVLGDSIMSTWTAATSSNWVRRAINNARSVSQATMFGEGAQSFSSRNRRARRLAGQGNIAIAQFGVNELRAATTLATTQAQMQTNWDKYASDGVRLFQSTITPTGVTTTDAYATVANQTLQNAAWNTTRNQLNAWLKDGAPIDATTRVAVATGTVANVYRAGEGTHPLSVSTDLPKGTVDVNPYIENDAVNGDGKFQVGTTNDGLHLTDTGHQNIATGVATALLNSLL